MFTRLEMDRAITCCRVKSSLGLDRVEYQIIKSLLKYLKDFLLDRYNFAYINNFVYNDWKRVQTIFVRKKEKKKVRPISLSSCVGKIMKRMINERLIWLEEREG